MHNELILAGFGGQGVLLIGKLLAYAGMKAGLEVTWMPAYGPEMRGGTCNCTVVLSDRQVGSPVTNRPHGAIVLNQQSNDKFEPLVRPGGILVEHEPDQPAPCGPTSSSCPLRPIRSRSTPGVRRRRTWSPSAPSSARRAW
jgi:Pyruvate/2-oxoacid:ferredoxin oxidoreductase gamma subunit